MPWVIPCISCRYVTNLHFIKLNRASENYHLLSIWQSVLTRKITRSRTNVVLNYDRYHTKLSKDITAAIAK